MVDSCFDDIVRKHWSNLVDRYKELGPLKDEYRNAVKLIKNCIDLDGKLLLCGNGGSAADADHIAGELMKSFLCSRPVPEENARALCEVEPVMGKLLSRNLEEGIPAVVLTHHTALGTAFMNDVNPAMVFAQQAYVYGRAGDILIGISTSGNAENVLLAAVTAKSRGMNVIGLTGGSGGNLKRFCDVCLCVPGSETYKVQELHLPLYHSLCIAIEDLFWGKEITE